MVSPSAPLIDSEGAPADLGAELIDANAIHVVDASGSDIAPVPIQLAVHVVDTCGASSASLVAPLNWSSALAGSEFNARRSVGAPDNRGAELIDATVMHVVDASGSDIASMPIPLAVHVVDSLSLIHI